MSRGAIPVSIGALAFFVVTGGGILWPRNIAWLSSPDDDSAMYFLGWHFFRHTPWQWPLGLNPRYGAELSNAIAFVDNVALFALPLKALDRWLPDPFQYFGLWMLLCFVLHAWFAWLLLGLLTQERKLRACGTALFVFAPPFLIRALGHYSLEGQWLILASLYVCFGPRRLSRGPAWPLLAFTVSLVHSYLTAMVLGLWLTDVARRLLFEGRRWQTAFQLLLVPACVFVGFWQAGLFVMDDIGTSGYGYYRMNVLSLFDPSGWSYFLKDIPEGGGDYEGFAYMGAGGLLLLLLGLPAARRVIPALRRSREYWPLLVFLLGATLFAISNNVGLAGRTLAIPIPEKLTAMASYLRSGGRMFWPAFYVLLWLLLRNVVKHWSPRVALALVALALFVQIADTSAGWLSVRRALVVSGTVWPTPLKSSFWSEVPSTYREIHMVLPGNKVKGYSYFSYFAATHDMATDAIYMARLDERKLKRVRHDALRMVNKGTFAKDTLYVLNHSFEKAASRSIDPERDLLATVDGFLIVAPGWRCRPQCRTATPAPEQDCAKACSEN